MKFKFLSYSESSFVVLTNHSALLSLINQLFIGQLLDKRVLRFWTCLIVACNVLQVLKTDDCCGGIRRVSRKSKLKFSLQLRVSNSNKIICCVSGGWLSQFRWVVKGQGLSMKIWNPLLVGLDCCIVLLYFDLRWSARRWSTSAGHCTLETMLHVTHQELSNGIALMADNSTGSVSVQERLHCS